MSCVASGAGRRQGSLEPEIRRYAKPYRKRLRKLAKASSRLGDLIVAFPAAAFAMVSNRGPAEARGAAVRLVKEGAPLPAVAEALALPGWTRWLAPEALQAPLGELETNAKFDREIANSVRRAASEQAMWLDWLLMARRYGDDAFALWLAKQDIYGGETTPAEAVIPLAAFAWHSVRPDAAARSQASKFWHGKMGFNSAAGEARSWFARVLKERCRAPVEVRGGWWKPQSVSGFKISPRDTKALLEQEGKAMNNCVATYWDAVRQGDCLIYGVRRGGSPVATMEVRADPHREGRATIVQLLGPGNVAVSPKVLSAAASWLAKQGPCPLRARSRMGVGAVDAPRWNETWSAYLEDRPDAALFAPDPSKQALDALALGYDALARAGKSA